MLRLAIVGFGTWGRNYHAAAMASGTSALTTTVLRPGSPHKAAAELAGLQVRERLDQLDDVDAAIVATHPQASPAICTQLLQQGLPIMLEKPAALSLSGAQEIAGAAEKARQVLLVNHQHLFSMAFEQLRERTRAAELLDIDSRGCNWGPFRDYDALWDYGPHDVAMCLALMDSMPSQVQCKTQKLSAGSSYDLELIFDATRRGRASIHLSNAETPKVRKLCTAGMLYDDADPHGHRLRQGGIPVELPAWQPPLTRSLTAFCQAVLEGGSDDYRFGAHWAVQVASVLEQAELSANRGSP